VTDEMIAILNAGGLPPGWTRGEDGAACAPPQTEDINVIIPLDWDDQGNVIKTTEVLIPKPVQT